MKKDRLVNIRFLFCVFIGLMVGIVVSRLFLSHIISVVVPIIITIIIVAIAIVGIVYAKRTELHNLKYKSRKNLSGIMMASSIGIVLAFVLGLVIVIVPLNNILKNKSYSGECAITGIVSEYVADEETYKKFVLSDCEVVESGIKTSLDFKILIYASTQVNVSLGDRVSFIAELDEMIPEDEYGFNSLINNIGYSTFLTPQDMIIGDNNASLRDVIHNKVYTLLNKHLNEDNANICYAVLFGQDEGLDEGITEMFSYAGISHILAVSGLHIGVLVGIILALFKKIKLNKFVKLGCFFSILFFYAYLCDFSPSVCRASLMALFLAICKTWGWEYDALSSMSLAGVIILLISPLMLFSISFQLSFMCIFAIITFLPCIKYALKKIKCPNWLADSLAISVAVNLAILPICMNSFGKVSLLGVLTNIVVLPLFTCVYVPLFVIVLISCIIKPLGVLLAVPNLFLHLVKVIASYIAQIQFGVFKVFNISYWSLVLIVLCTLMIHYLMTRHWAKIVAVGVVATAIGVLFVLNAVPMKYEGDTLIAPTQYKSNVVIAISDNEVSLIGSDIEYKKLLFILKGLRLNKIDKIYAYDLQLNNLDELNKICHNYNVAKIFIPNGYDYGELKSRFDNVDLLDTHVHIDNLHMQIIDYGDETIAVKMLIKDKEVLIPQLNNNKKECAYLQENFAEVDYVLTGGSDEFAGINATKHCFTSEDYFIKG